VHPVVRSSGRPRQRPKIRTVRRTTTDDTQVSRIQRSHYRYSGR
jgi:hypothetical protein